LEALSSLCVASPTKKRPHCDPNETFFIFHFLRQAQSQPEQKETRLAKADPQKQPLLERKKVATAPEMKSSRRQATQETENSHGATSLDIE
jgi:hypothetical protein